MAKLAAPIRDSSDNALEIKQMQIVADTERADLISELSTKEQKQFKLVEKICGQLAKNDVKFYLFTLQPGKVSGANRDVLYHWNANGRYISYNPDNFPTEKSIEYIKRMNNGLIYWIYRVIFCNNFLSHFTSQQKWDSICKTIDYALHEQEDYLKGKK